MWYSALERTHFLKNLYNDVPELKNVRIGEFSVQDEGQIVSISFDMPYYADNPPEKWVKQGYNTINVRLDFTAIRELSLKSGSQDFRGNIEINKDESDLLQIEITGTINAFIKAESGFLQSVEGYINGNLF
ncbi:Imm50 family immunity protein [Neobacillus massiliamazoniensis]|uniref:Immunity protein 50 n=1 Tax=Neobacillus massiliamazoniensis TaxID=1499688 RepID=A0A0U1P392_9BACI|nr:Imm50 family immunity protein [Neobacillus massiliamazoniensis]CRK84582.1 hypothetical protein BN000_04624 [Neobacillus massiliamazoniensis]